MTSQLLVGGSVCSSSYPYLFKDMFRWDSAVKMRMKGLPDRSVVTYWVERKTVVFSRMAWVQRCSFPLWLRFGSVLKRIVIHCTMTWLCPLADGGGERRRLGYAMCSTLPPRVHPGLGCVTSLSDRPRIHLPHPTALWNGGAVDNF